MLDDVMSKEPLGPVVPLGDDQWFNVVKWTVFATIEAEELGITQANVADMVGSDNPVVAAPARRARATSAPSLGLANDWVVDVITAVGNYGEIYDRNLGPDTPFDLDRGLEQRCGPRAACSTHRPTAKRPMTVPGRVRPRPGCRDCRRMTAASAPIRATRHAAVARRARPARRSPRWSWCWSSWSSAAYLLHQPRGHGRARLTFGFGFLSAAPASRSARAADPVQRRPTRTARRSSSAC